MPTTQLTALVNAEVRVDWQDVIHTRDYLVRVERNGSHYRYINGIPASEVTTDFPIPGHYCFFVTARTENRFFLGSAESDQNARTCTSVFRSDPSPRCAGPVGQHDLVLNTYNDQVSRGYNLNLDAVEAGANRHNGNDNHVVLQSLFDPVVVNKDIIIDEYLLTVRPGSNLDSEAKRQALLRAMAADMDALFGGDFASQADFKLQGTTPAVGQVIDIDVDPGIVDIVPINAPVVITHVESTCFGVKTIEYNGAEHILHGDRRWGYVVAENGDVHFYTRGLSIPDRVSGLTISGEFRFWTAWLDGIERYVTAGGGEVLQGGKRARQEVGHDGAPYWDQISSTLRNEIKAAQISGHQREADRLQADIDQASAEGQSIGVLHELNRFRDVHVDEVAGWQAVRP